MLVVATAAFGRRTVPRSTTLLAGASAVKRTV